MEKKLLKMKVPPHQHLESVEIQQVEMTCLDRVFKWLSSLDKEKGPDEMYKKITFNDLKVALKRMKTTPTPAEIKYMIWEVDDDLDGMIS